MSREQLYEHAIKIIDDAIDRCGVVDYKIKIREVMYLKPFLQQLSILTAEDTGWCLAKIYTHHFADTFVYVVLKDIQHRSDFEDILDYDVGLKHLWIGII